MKTLLLPLGREKLCPTAAYLTVSAFIGHGSDPLKFHLDTALADIWDYIYVTDDEEEYDEEMLTLVETMMVETANEIVLMLHRRRNRDLLKLFDRMEVVDITIPRDDERTLMIRYEEIK